MAVLEDGKLGLEIRFRPDYDGDFVEYDVRFLWNGESIVRDEVLRIDNEYWSSRLSGGFRVSDHGDDLLINCIRRALDTDTASYWEPIEPFISLQFMPGISFDSLASMWQAATGTDVSDSVREYFRSVREDLQHHRQDTTFLVIAMVDAFNMRDESLFQGSGPSIVLHVKRNQLERFADELSSEYQAVKPPNIL